MEFLFQETQGGVELAVVHVVEETQYKHVLTAIFFLGTEGEVLECFARNLGDVNADDLKMVEAVIVEGIGFVMRKAQVFAVETIGVDDDDGSAYGSYLYLL